MKKIVLASASPRRKKLLKWAEVEFDVLPGETDESFPETLPLEEIPVYIAKRKASTVKAKELFKRYEINIPVLAADTIVVLDGQIIGKPSDRMNAIEILQRLSGKTHKVITGVVISGQHKEICFSDTTEVTFHDLSDEDISYYVDNYQPYDKAGAYAIQEWIGVIGIQSINGDFYNVMGLPVSRVIAALKEHFDENN